MNNGSIDSRSSATIAGGVAGIRMPVNDGMHRSEVVSERFDAIFEDVQQRPRNEHGHADQRRQDCLQPKEERVEDASVAVSSNVKDAKKHEAINHSDASEAGSSAKQANVEKCSLDGEEQLNPEQSPVVVSDSNRSTEKAVVENGAIVAGKENSALVSTTAIAMGVRVNSSFGMKVQVHSSKKVVAQGEAGANGKKAVSPAVVGQGEAVANGKKAVSPAVVGQGEAVANGKKAVSPAVAGQGEAGANGKQAVSPAVAASGEVKANANVNKANAGDGKAIAATGLNKAMGVLDGKSAASKSVVAIAANAAGLVSPNEKGSKLGRLSGGVSASEAKMRSVSEMNANESNVEKAVVKKAPIGSAKTSTHGQAISPAAELGDLKNMLKTTGLGQEGRIRGIEYEIGIKSAEQLGSKLTKMSKEEKNSEVSVSERGFLKETSDAGTVNRVQAVNSRSDTGGSFSNSHHQGGQASDQGNHSRGGEQLRQWIEGNSEVKGVSQGAQQTELVDRAVASVLSARVLNQIVNHIERMRESEKNRVKVTLGSDAGGVTVDIRIVGGEIHTSFEGDPGILNQLQEEWSDIKERASRKGVVLSDPEFNVQTISYSSSSEGNRLLPDDGNQIEGESQSVIQHENNQPTRPSEMAAVAGSSGPVLSYA